MWKIYRENSHDLSFALANLFSQSIDIREFNLWIDRVILQMPTDETPHYIFDLIDFNQGLCHIYEIIGFVPNSDLSEAEKNALTGIAFARNINLYEPDMTKAEALKALEENPHILDRYRLFFPFIEIYQTNVF